MMGIGYLELTNTYILQSGYFLRGANFRVIRDGENPRKFATYAYVHACAVQVRTCVAQIINLQTSSVIQLCENLPPQKIPAIPYNNILYIYSK